MNIKQRKTIHFKLLFFVVFNCICVSKTQSQNIIQDSKFEQLLADKRKINNSITVYNRYKIQLFSGSNEIAKKELLTFKKENKNVDATIIFNTPIYKVLAGNFKTRIEAERNLNLFKKKYPNAILIKPNK